MLHLKDGWPSKSPLGAISALIFHHSVVFSLLTHRCGGQSQVVTPSQPIVVTVGDDIMLPCHLEPAVDAADLTIEWSRPDLNPRFVYVWRDGMELESKKHPSYVGRTSVTINKLKHGDISLKLCRVQLSDKGTYRCFIPTLNSESTVELVVGSVSSSDIEISKVGSRVLLECKSKGWYPEPEVCWLDNEGNLLSAEPTETVRGPDGLYAVSSRVTVEKRHSNIICRVQQKNINQTRETQIHVPGGIFSAPCSSAAHITISLTVVFLVILVVVFVVWKWRRKQNSNNITTFATTNNNTELPLLIKEKGETLKATGESTDIKDLDEKKANLDAQLKEVEEGLKSVVWVMSLLMDQKRVVDDQIHDLVLQLHKIKENQSQLPSPVKNIKQKEENDTNYSDKKQNEKECLDTKINQLDTEKTELEKKLQDTDTISKYIWCGVTIVTEKKTALDNLKEQLNQQLDEIEQQRGGIKKGGSIHLIVDVEQNHF